MIIRAARFDAPFWGLLLGSVLFVSASGLIGLAAAAQSAVTNDAAIVAYVDPYAVEPAAAPPSAETPAVARAFEVGERLRANMSLPLR